MLTDRPQPGSAGRQPSRRRDRHGRGMRGPLAVRGPLAPTGVPVARSRAQRFDDMVLDALERLERRLPDELTSVEVAVEEVPPPDRLLLSDDIPLGAVLTTGNGPRIVIYRRPIELRAGGRAELAALVSDVVLEQVAELLGRHPEDIDPG
ncbi:metallopeptidase family protein [Flindersiella endophytica]